MCKYWRLKNGFGITYKTFLDTLTVGKVRSLINSYDVGLLFWVANLETSKSYRGHRHHLSVSIYFKCCPWVGVNTGFTPSYTDKILSRPSLAFHFATIYGRETVTISPEFHWQNMVAKLSQFPRKFRDHAYHFCKTTPGTYLDVAIAKNSRNSRGNCDSFATMFCQWNSRGNCDSFATIYGRETECKRRLRKYSVSITRGAPFEWAICLNVSKE